MYKIEYLENAKGKYFQIIPNDKKILIKRAIEERLTVDPVSFGKPLRRSLKKHFRLRLADYRIIYRVNEACKVVTIVAIEHRIDIYK